MSLRCFFSSFGPLSPEQSVQGTGLAFIAFTEAMTHFPASPFWSVMFFLMLINLGLGSMIGTMSGITTPIIDTFKVRKEVFTGEGFSPATSWGRGGESSLPWRVTPAEYGHGGCVLGPAEARTGGGLGSPWGALTVPICSPQLVPASLPLWWD